MKLGNLVNILKHIALVLPCIFSLTFFSSCQRKHVCPAYNSSFILDEKKTNQFFSLFGEDSLPKSDFYVNKNKRGIIVKIKFHKKQKEMNTVKMKMIYPPANDSIRMVNDSFYAMSQEQIDSAFAAGARAQMKFNRDQAVYMRHIAPYYGAYEEDLYEPRRRPEPVEQQVENESEPDEKPKRKWFWNRKKSGEPPQEEEPQPIDQLKDF